VVAGREPTAARLTAGRSTAGRRATRGRDLDWEGCFNARDLGGLPVLEGGVTRRGALVRADALSDLTVAGWAALQSHGIRTVIDLRNDDERSPDIAQRPEQVTTIRLPLDGSEDRAFWDIWASGPQFGTPLYYRPHLETFPQRSVAVIRAIALAPPGGVAFHCVGGRDRSGQVAMLALTLAGVPAKEIAADYALSAKRLPARYAARGQPDQGPELEAFLARRRTSATRIIVELLERGDVPALLSAGGLTPADVLALRTRVVQPSAV
jgi:protein tyrosine/serine phosphatase